MYVVIAYRYGKLNEPSELVGGSIVEVEAIRLASNYWQHRGGKYGCAVYNLSQPNENGSFTYIHYIRSSAQENQPYSDEHLDRLLSLGIHIFNNRNNYSDEMKKEIEDFIYLF